MKTAAASKLRGLQIGRQARPGLAETLGVDEQRKQSFTLLAVDKIHPNPNQPRKKFNPEKLEELALSIRERGVLMPIRVRQLKLNEEYEIIAGERRWRAAKDIGLTEIPAVIVADQTEDQAFIDALVENVVREDLNAIDRAQALIQVKVHLGALSWDDVVKSGVIGISRRQVFHLLGLTTLPEPVQDDIRSGTLTEKHGRALRLLRANPALLEKARKQIKAKGISGEEALALVKSLRKGTAKPQTFSVTYHTDLELIAALEAKIRQLRADKPT